MNEIVVGVDESETARRAAMEAARIAVDSGDTLHIVICVKDWAEDITIGTETFRVDSVTSAEQYIKKIDLGTRPANVTHAVSLDSPADALCSEAERLGARMIVVGNRRVQGASRILGSVAMDVVRQAPCDVLVANTTGG